MTLNPAGGFHAVTHQNVLLTGTDNHGNEYIGSLTDETVFDARVGQELTHPLILVAISQGTAPNITIRILLRFTVNADGTVTALVTDVTATCQGGRRERQTCACVIGAAGR